MGYAVTLNFGSNVDRCRWSVYWVKNSNMYEKNSTRDAFINFHTTQRTAHNSYSCTAHMYRQIRSRSGCYVPYMCIAQCSNESCECRRMTRDARVLFVRVWVWVWVSQNVPIFFSRKNATQTTCYMRLTLSRLLCMLLNLICCRSFESFQHDNSGRARCDPTWKNMLSDPPGLSIKNYTLWEMNSLSGWFH